jgi:hypothetical protein
MPDFPWVIIFVLFSPSGWLKNKQQKAGNTGVEAK